MPRIDRPHGHPRNAQGVGDDGPVHGLADHDPRAEELVQDLLNGTAGIDEVQSGLCAGFLPEAPPHALPMRHEGCDLRPSPGGIDERSGQDGRIADRQHRIEPKRRGRPGATHEVEAPVAAEVGDAPVRRHVTGAGDDLGPGAVEAVVEDRSDAEKQHRVVVVEDLRKKPGPHPRVEVVAEVRLPQSGDDQFHIARPAPRLSRAERFAARDARS
jgi:hypothetical protein